MQKDIYGQGFLGLNLSTAQRSTKQRTKNIALVDTGPAAAIVMLRA
jgi:hypothetical protein